LQVYRKSGYHDLMAKKAPPWADRKGSMRKAIAGILKAYRDAQGWNQTELAEELSKRAGDRRFTQGFVSEFESGEKPVTIEYLALFVEALDVPLLQLLKPVLPVGPHEILKDISLLELVEEAHQMRSTGKLTASDFETVASRVRAEFAEWLVQETETASERVARASAVNNDPRFVELIKLLAGLEPADWVYFADLADGVRLRRRRPGWTRTSLSARGARLKEPGIFDVKDRDPNLPEVALTEAVLKRGKKAASARRGRLAVAPTGQPEVRVVEVSVDRAAIKAKNRREAEVKKRAAKALLTTKRRGGAKKR
jgi:transcriptional regulator with XRE-family HTH domain